MATIYRAPTLALVSLWLLAGPAMAAINLEWRPASQTAGVGASVGLGLYAVSDSPQDQSFSSVQVIVDWDPTYLKLTGNSTVGALGFLGSSFLPGDSFGINEATPPADGDGMWFGLAPFGQQLSATPQGSLLTTIMFQVLSETSGTWVTMLSSAQYQPRPPAIRRC